MGLKAEGREQLPPIPITSDSPAPCRSDQDSYLICIDPDNPVVICMERIKGKIIKYCEHVLDNGSCRLVILRCRRLTKESEGAEW